MTPEVLPQRDTVRERFYPEDGGYFVREVAITSQASAGCVNMAPSGHQGSPARWHDWACSSTGTTREEI